MNVRLYDYLAPIEPDFKYSSIEPWYVDFRKGASYYQLAMIKDKSTNFYKLCLRFYRADKKEVSTDTKASFTVENDCRPGRGEWWKTARVLSTYQKSSHPTIMVYEDFKRRCLDRMSHGYFAKTARLPDKTVYINELGLRLPFNNDLVEEFTNKIKESCKLYLDEISSSNS